MMAMELWDSRYSEDGFAYGKMPDAYLSSFPDTFRPGQKVLAIGDGEGRNSVWLAEQVVKS